MEYVVIGVAVAAYIAWLAWELANAPADPNEKKK